MSSPSAPLQVLVCQFNPVVGDLEGNARRILEACAVAHGQGRQLVVTPELALSGYPPEDLLLRPAFMARCESLVQEIAQATSAWPGLRLVLGHPAGRADGTAPVAAADRSVQDRRVLNAASVLGDGAVLARHVKRELPNYQVFDERRYFVSGRELALDAATFEVAGLRLGLLICEDAWFAEPAEQAASAGAQALLVLNASPFHLGKGAEREARMAERARACGLPLLYAHMVGGQDELVFDGASFALDAQGQCQARAPAFEACGWPLQLLGAGADARWEGTLAPHDDEDASLWKALVMGVRDYVGKNRFPGAILGLSGGVDSALVLAVAVDALGADKVRAVMMPSPYTAEISWVDARDMAARLGVQYDEIDIRPMFEDFKRALSFDFAGKPEDATEENIQARVRGTLLMAMSNKSGRIVLTTGNKSEMATGYCTLYGDMAGGFAVIKDLVKTRVYRLCQWKNAQPTPLATGGTGAAIPERIITRPPSAELRPDQTDQDSLPPYEVLDAILERYMENDEPIASLLADGFSPADVERVTRLLQINEYKRRQAPVGVRVTRRSFGKDWRYPMTNRFRA